MKAFTIAFKDLQPGPDNPAGRWDVGFHVLRLAAIRLANQIAATPEAFDGRAFLALAKGDRERAQLKSRIDHAKTQAELVQLLLAEMKLTEPRPELRRGLELIAQRLAHENALRLTRQAADLLKQAKTLRDMN